MSVPKIVILATNRIQIALICQNAYSKHFQRSEAPGSCHGLLNAFIEVQGYFGRQWSEEGCQKYSIIRFVDEKTDKEGRKEEIGCEIVRIILPPSRLCFSKFFNPGILKFLFLYFAKNHYSTLEIRDEIVNGLSELDFLMVRSWPIPCWPVLSPVHLQIWIELQMHTARKSLPKSVSWIHSSNFGASCSIYPSGRIVWCSPWVAEEKPRYRR